MESLDLYINETAGSDGGLPVYMDVGAFYIDGYTGYIEEVAGYIAGGAFCITGAAVYIGFLVGAVASRNGDPSRARASG